MKRHSAVRARWKVKHLQDLDSSCGDSEDDVRYIPCVKQGELKGLDAVYITLESGKRLPLHTHRRSTCVVFVVDGRAVARIGRRSIRVMMNDFVLIPPGTRHGFHALKEPVTLFTLHTPPLYSRAGAPDITYHSGPRRRTS